MDFDQGGPAVAEVRYRSDLPSLMRRGVARN
jgi:hypothetical protein